MKSAAFPYFVVAAEVVTPSAHDLSQMVDLLLGDHKWFGIEWLFTFPDGFLCFQFPLQSLSLKHWVWKPFEKRKTPSAFHV
ncbi:MAG TPA: hypothetical protein VFG14_18915, partial [Chthoniobacteraceae bacterium]|nr:hypothetical protein [Chthoniobacteraceae bacterium]